MLEPATHRCQTEAEQSGALRQAQESVYNICIYIYIHSFIHSFIHTCMYVYIESVDV